VVETPTNAIGVGQSTLGQNVAFDDIGKPTVQFLANGTGQAIITFVPQEQAYERKLYLNSFELFIR